MRSVAPYWSVSEQERHAIRSRLGAKRGHLRSVATRGQAGPLGRLHRLQTFAQPIVNFPLAKYGCLDSTVPIESGCDEVSDATRVAFLELSDRPVP